MQILVRETYEIFTPESVEDGEAAERGFIDEDGSHFTFRELVELLTGSEASSSHYHAGVWYTKHGEADCRTGATENRSYHLVGASERVQRRLFAVVSSLS